MSSFNCKPLRWGIIGCGKISNDFCIALSTLPKEDHVIEHVAARDAKRAEEFARKSGAHKHAGSYLNVCSDEDVDVCYIGTLNPSHKELSILAMKHGKAVLCEKPAAMNLQELDDVIACALQCNVFYMEAVWTRCFPLYRDIQSKLAEDRFGEVNVVMGSFGIPIFEVDRIRDTELGGGVMIDIGVYLLTVCDMMFAGKTVKDVSVTGHVDGPTGLDRSGNITFLFEGNKMASLLYSGDHTLPNQLKVICDKGTIDVLQPFWCPDKYTESLHDSSSSPAQVCDFSLPCPPMEMFFTNSMGLKFEAEHVRECLLQGRKESPLISHATSKRVIGWMDQLRAQMKPKV